MNLSQLILKFMFGSRYSLYKEWKPLNNSGKYAWLGNNFDQKLKIGLLIKVQSNFAKFNQQF